IIYKRAGFSFFLLSLIAAYFLDSVYNPVSIIFMITGVIFEALFRCPYCKRQLDPRLRSYELSFCPRCGHSFSDELSDD
ncbi:MAG TPA: hypothetical protein VHP81_12740, partial [Lachnospiraceae bacterium]|nr:hypothetical protein [Lachnospiraceae bacterium]